MKTILKRCEKCGRTSMVRPRVRRCKRQNYGPQSYWCYGKLTAVPVEKKPKPVKAKPSAVEVWEKKLAEAKRREVLAYERLTSKAEAMGRAAKESKLATRAVVRCQQKLTEAQHVLPRIRRGIEL